MASKRILITGACSGLGKALAERYSAAGYEVTVADIAPSEAAPPQAHYVRFDCEHPTFAWLADAEAFDIVICNAGISNSDDFLHTGHEHDSRLMQINALGHIALVRELLKAGKVNDDGRLAFVISGTVFLPFSIAIAYAASKAALDGFAHALAPYVYGRGISVTRIYPGPMKTPHAEKYYAKYNEGKGTSPERVAACIVGGIEARKQRIMPDAASRLFWLASSIVPRLLVRMVAKKYHGNVS